MNTTPRFLVLATDTSSGHVDFTPLNTTKKVRSKLKELNRVSRIHKTGFKVNVYSIFKSVDIDTFSAKEPQDVERLDA